MSNQILIKRGTSSPTPTLEYGELGYNSTEGTLYIGNSNRENVAIGGPGAFVKKSGDTMTGILTTKGLTIHNVDTDYPSLTFQAKDATNHSILIQPNLSDGVRQFAIYQYPSDSDDAETRYYEAYKLPTTPDGLTANGLYNILTTKNPVTVAQGGTGATTAAGARNNLSVPYYAKYDAGNLQTGAGNASAWITYYGDDGTTYNQMDLTKTATQFSKPVNIASGGTGANTPKGAEYNINGSIAESTETIGDAHRLVFSRTTPTATNGVFIYKQASLLWNYIKGKSDDQYLKLSGGTLTGNLTVNKTDSSGFVALKEDGEGGTIQIGSKNGTYTYEIDAYNDSTIRLHQAPKHPDGITNKFLTWHGDTGQLDASSLTLGSALAVAYGGTGFTNLGSFQSELMNSYNVPHGIDVAATDVLSLPPGIYHHEDATSTDNNYPISASRALVEVMGQYRAGTAATDGYPNGYWSICVTYPYSGEKYWNHRTWSTWTGWRLELTESTGVKKTGDTMTGILWANGGFAVKGNYDINILSGTKRSYGLKTEDGNTIVGGMSIDPTTNRVSFTQKMVNQNYYETYYLPSPASTAANKDYTILTTKSAVTVAQGGTGKTTLTSGQALIGNGTGAITTRAITNNTSKGPLSSASTWTNSSNLATINTLAYWNGAHIGTTSNLSVLGTVTTGKWQATAVGIQYGGTGATSARAAEYNICNGIAQVTSAMDDDTQIIIKRTSSASTTNGVFCYRNASLLKSYLFVYSSSTPSSSHNVTGKIWLKPV